MSEPAPVNKAFKELRKRLGYTQQSFAADLGLVLRTITHYEKDRTPPPNLINHLAGLAYKHEHKDLFQVFYDAWIGEVGVSIENWNAYLDLMEAMSAIEEFHGQALLANGFDRSALEGLEFGMCLLYDGIRKLQARYQTMDGHIVEPDFPDYSLLPTKYHPTDVRTLSHPYLSSLGRDPESVQQGLLNRFPKWRDRISEAAQVSPHDLPHRSTPKKKRKG
jgi:transcriptional regulator with XRE-family HTH domain